MATAEMTSSIRIGALDMSVVTSREEDGLHQHDPTLPAGKAGTLTDRTDADTGIITVAEGHGITDSDTVDVQRSRCTGCC